MSQSTNPIMRFFAFAHLAGPLRQTSERVAQLAKEMDAELPDSPEKSAGLRKLLEAKDCFVRATLSREWPTHEQGGSP